RRAVAIVVRARRAVAPARIDGALARPPCAVCARARAFLARAARGFGTARLGRAIDARTPAIGRAVAIRVVARHVARVGGFRLHATGPELAVASTCLVASRAIAKASPGGAKARGPLETCARGIVVGDAVAIAVVPHDAAIGALGSDAAWAIDAVG